MDEDNDRKFKQLSQLEHVKTRPAMYIGSTELQTIDMYLLNDDKTKFILKSARFTPAFLKICDEIIVNAIDHHTNYPKKVKNIDITFSIKSGTITVKNNGPGISIIKVDTLNSGKIYKPQAIFSEFLGGDNLENSDRIVGGQNGLGAKCTNAFSNIFKIETYDIKRKKLYKQVFKDRLECIEPPEITDEELKEEYTQIRFTPDYVALGYKKYTEEIGRELSKLLEARAYQAAAFVNCDVSFNKKPIEVNNFQDFSKLFLNEEDGIYNTVLTHPENKKLNLEVCIGISDGKFRQASIINGIWVYMGGNHIKHIQNEIIENIKPIVEKELKKTKSKFNSNFIINNLFILVKGSIINPEFNSQSKEKITVPVEKFKDYKFKNKDWKEIWAILETPIMASILGKIQDKKKSKVTRGKVVVEKGEDAKWAGDKKKARETTLVICEGDSALGVVTRGINHKNTELDKDYYGTFSIQGVPLNARKECKEMYDKKNECSIKVRNETLKTNKRFNDLIKLLGLDYQKSYTINTHAGDEEFMTLRYGRVVVAVDQDEDGKGQIFGLLLNFFIYFWPALIDRGYIKRFNTPIIRAYPNDTKKLVKEFCTLYSYKQWIKKEFKDDETAAKYYKIKYYKGLATHDKPEIRPMFNKFEKKLYTYELDDNAEKNMEVYFGLDTNLRKDVLVTPVAEEDELNDEQLNIPVSLMLRTDVKEFQRDNIIRKLPHVMDGMVPSRRKAFYTARDVFKAANAKEIKVCNFSGMVMKKTNYHHGDASLSETIIKMGQNFVGAKNLPLLIGVGEFGSRQMGGKDSGSPRYVAIKLNYNLTNALYPRIDDYLLPYIFDEGDRCEPKYYMPIIPTSILEHTVIPATGWKAEIWERDYKDVIKNVRNMITGDYKKCKKLKLWLRGNKCDIRLGSDDKTYIVGTYEYDKKEDVLTITELPPTVINNSYIKSVAYNKDVLKPEFREVYDHSNYDEETNIDEVKIKFGLMPGVYEKLMSKKDDTLLFDPIEEFMKLKIVASSHINMIDINGKVKEYKYYSWVVNEWFNERKKLYEERIDRAIILTNLMIKYLKNIIRFSKERDDYGITNKTPEKKFNEILEKYGYDKFNKTLLLSPKYTAIKDLEKLIISSADEKNNDDKKSYEYIINLSYRQLLGEACKKRDDELKEEEQKLKDLLDDCNGGFKGQKTWLKELETLEKIIDEGVNKGWNYTKNKPRFVE